jgi:hypothetical protein
MGIPQAPSVETPPVDPELLADAIRRIAGGMTKLNSTGVNRRGIEVLLYDATGNGPVAKRDITKVLDGLSVLEHRYCRR